MARQAGGARFAGPGRYILNMVVFIIIVGAIAALLFPTLQEAFQANPPLNGLLEAVLLIGMIVTLRQAGEVAPCARWLKEYRANARPANAPGLIAAMANLLPETPPLPGDKRTLARLSTQTPVILDSVGSRMDEGRATARYMIGLLVFLGLLGTFWGLLETVNGVSGVIGTLDPTTTSEGAAVSSLIAGLQRPLAGMGTAFSSSLFGLASSLVLGFLDLQASHAQNRFYNDLEEQISYWVSPSDADEV
ncbi:MAG: hypothetical protein AAGL49_12025 [Pseudomonadota bacterium]